MMVSQRGFPSVIRNSRGQMAVFVALIFQVLFVFFAMIINVGLLVHDKINLQNSADIAAIYAAQRQAEILNAIAHSNYQIRQSWKLLSWRIRVLGDSGRRFHPLGMPAGSATETADPDLLRRDPAVCITHDLWRGQDGNNICKSDKMTLRKIPRTTAVPGVALFPWNRISFDLADRQIATFEKICRDIGPGNWRMAALWFVAYKTDVANRRGLIRQLASYLQTGDDGMKDLTGASVKTGVEKTLKANLTAANKAGLEDGDIRVFNSLAGYDSRVWLPDIAVAPTVPYVDFDCKGSTSADPAQAEPKILGKDLPYEFTDRTRAEAYDPGGGLREKVVEPGDTSDIHHSAAGVEKNPWYMAYVGVSVKTKARHPFSPFGGDVELTARAFAKPFGGRTGPWYGKLWSPESDRSDGELVDENLPERVTGNQFAYGGGNQIPNYSKYPGDRVGLSSQLALASMKAVFSGLFQNTLTPISQKAYDYIVVAGEDPKGGDILAFVPNSQPLNYWVRDLEVAALAPDLFDVTYYSIEPNYYENYILPARGGFGDGLALRGDLGWRQEEDAFKKFNVALQIEKTKEEISKQHVSTTAFYHVQNSNLLLTDWAPVGPGRYEFPEKFFGQCPKPVKPEQVHIPGECIAGGRTGYSIKIISKDYLLAGDLELGGPGTKGPIRNPPPANF